MPEEKKYEPASLSIDRKGMLRAHPIFRNLPEDALLHLERIAKTRSIRRGVSIFAKGDPGNALFFVASGTVKISVSSIEGRGAVFNLIKSGEIFGEIALLDGLARTADASSNSDCELVVIERRDFIRFMEHQPLLAKNLIDMLCARIRWISDHVEQVIFPGLSGRLAKALIRLVDKNSTTPSLKIVITQQEISEMVGTSRESVNKLLRDWKDRNLVHVQRGTLTIVDIKTLRQLAEEE